MAAIGTKDDGTFAEGTTAPVPTGTVAAAGTTQGDAGALATGFNLVSASNGTKGVVLPAGARGKVVKVKNNVGSTLPVYPPSGGTINALASNTSIVMVSSAAAEFVCYDGSAWYSCPLLPS